MSNKNKKKHTLPGAFGAGKMKRDVAIRIFIRVTKANFKSIRNSTVSIKKKKKKKGTEKKGVIIGTIDCSVDITDILKSMIIFFI